MEAEISKAFAEYWADKDHTKSMLEVFGRSLNPPVELSTNDNTDEMVAECLRHCEANGIALVFDEEAGAWRQGVAVVGTQDAVSPPMQQSTLPRPEDGQPDPAQIGAGAPTPPEAPDTFVVPGEVFECVDQIEALFTLPPAHQNFLTDAARSRSGKGLRLTARIRELLNA